ncbi:MAG: tRNA pseudouridine(55) synthase TruB [Acidobacteria bacterium]|nr:tRNA pseudouridine(55) synthase TruB [Acidobacteriota bacterium]
MDGLLVVDKPVGPTSHDVVDIVRRLLETRRVGHVGTLDPSASGVLPLVIGKATRLARFFTGDRKEYVATILLGTRTDTFDLEGAVVEIRPVRVHAADLTRTMAAMVGRFAQQPPPFSAKKIGGTRAYRLARAGIVVAPTPVGVTLFEVELLETALPLIIVRLVTSGGFYVRAFADDLGQRLCCGACVKTLRRTRSGPFTLADGCSLAHLVETPGAAERHLVPMGKLLPDLPGVTLTAEGVRRATAGREVGPADLLAPVELGDRMRLLSEDGTLVAVAERGASGLLHPSIVLV